MKIKHSQPPRPLFRPLLLLVVYTCSALLLTTINNTHRNLKPHFPGMLERRHRGDAPEGHHQTATAV